MLTIGEELRELLGLPILETRKASLANGEVVEVNVAGPIEIRFENRRVNTDAYVLPECSEVLLGVIPMEEMDVLIDPLRQKLIVNPAHPDMAVLSLK